MMMMMIMIMMIMMVVGRMNLLSVHTLVSGSRRNFARICSDDEHDHDDDDDDDDLSI